MREIYLDNGATTKISKEVLDEFNKSVEEYYGNPSSLHRLGFEAEKKMKEARQNISSFLKVKENEVYFTSGGTESNNLAIQGTYLARHRTHNKYITTNIEHPSIIEVYKELEFRGAEVIYLEVDEKGNISLEDLENHLDENVGLVSIGQVNSEIGTIKDISKIGEIIKNNSNGYFHVDGVQAYGKINTDLKNVDIYTFNSHKIHGLKGTGGIYINENIRIRPIIYGGGQESGLVSGTENLNGIIAFNKATEIAFNNMEENYKYISLLKKEFMEIENQIEDVYFNGDLENSSPYILNMSILNIRGEVLLHALANKGIYISTGSACSSRKSDKNIIAKLGHDNSRVDSTIRISFSKYNTIEEIKIVKDIIIEEVSKLRKYIRK